MVAFLLLVGLAWASPAQDLFDQATVYLVDYYGGFSRADVPKLIIKYQNKLNRSCASIGETCPVAKANAVLQELVAELGDSHTNFYPSSERDSLRSLLIYNWNQELSYGLQTLRIPGSREHWILQVRLGSPAAKADLRRGDKIVALGDQPLPEKAQEAYELLERPFKEGQAIALKVQRGTNQLELTLKSAAMDEAELPSLQLRPDGVAVLRIPDFETKGLVGQQVHRLVAEANSKGAKAMVVDLRDNPGGLVSEFLSSGAAFVGNFSRQFKTRQGSFEQGFRDGLVYAKRMGGREANLALISQPSRWEGPLAVLVNSRSASGAEFFALDMQYSKRGLVIGELTLGIGNTTTAFFELADGSGLQITTSMAVLPDGQAYPPRSTPDIQVADDLEALAGGHDLPLEKAIEALGIR